MITMLKTSSVHEMKNLRREISTLRSFIIGVAGTDKEGNYNPLIVREILAAANEPITHHYSGKESLLKQLKKI